MIAAQAIVICVVIIAALVVANDINKLGGN